MRKTFCLCFLLQLSYIVSFSQNSVQIKILGNLTGSFSGKMYLFFEGNIRQKDSISAEVKNGKFEFDCLNISLPILARLHLGSHSYIADFYIEGKTTEVFCSNNIRMENPKDTFNMLNIDSVRSSKMEAARHDFEMSFLRKNLNSLSADEQLKIYERIKSIVQSNSKNKLSMYVINGSIPFLSVEQTSALLEYVDTLLYNTFEGQTAIKRIEAKRRVAGNRAMSGNLFHHVTLPDNDGKPVNTKDINAHCLLIACWSSWCAPCRKEHPRLKALYRKYKDLGLEIVGISFDNNIASWKKAINDDKLEFTQLIDKKGVSGELGKFYGIEGIPTFFLIDKNGRLVKDHITLSEAETHINMMCK